MKFDRLIWPPTLIARKPGFLEGGNQGHFRIVPGQGLILPLVPESLIIGRVVLPSAEPAERIHLDLYRQQVHEGRAHWVLAGSATARSSGEFRLAELSAGTYKLLTRELLDRDPLIFRPGGQLYGYPPVYYPNATDFASAAVIRLSAGKTFQADLTLTRQPYYPVKVAVANVPSVLGIAVRVSTQGRPGPGFSLGYNPEDQTIEGALPNGTYTLEASSSGPVSATGILRITVRDAPLKASGMILVPNRTIRVNLREEFTSVENDLPQGPESSRPDARVQRRYLNVILEPTDDFGDQQSVTLRPPTNPKDDTLALENVHPGRYWVRFDAARGYVASATSGAVDLLQQPLLVALGGATSAIEVTLRDDGAEIDGVVEGADAPASGTENPESSGLVTMGAPSFSLLYSPAAHVYCVPVGDSSGQFREFWVGQDGKFNSPLLAPGAYRVLAFDHAQDQLEYHNTEAMLAYDSKGQLVSLVAGQKEYLRLRPMTTSGQ
ncbi:MAG TPA: hypothetical protein VEV41_15920 [Terriglobales bacterium]|nr:hypothetical protein [Terriglobales bacterium]